MRTCTKCGADYPETPEFFSRHGKGLRPDCKGCQRKRLAAYYEANRGTILERNRAWAVANPEKRREVNRRWQATEQYRAYQLQWQRTNRDKSAEYMARWRQKHREQYNAYDRSYRERTRPIRREQTARIRTANRDRYRAYGHKRRALELAGGSFTAADVRKQIAVQGGRCRWCSKPLSGRRHIDHVIPLARGGTNTPENLVVSCPPCNHRKSSRLPFSEWTPPNPLPL